MEKPIQLKQNLAYSGWQISEKTAKESISDATLYGLEFKDILKALSMGMKYYDPKYDNYVKILKHPDRQGYTVWAVAPAQRRIMVSRFAQHHSQSLFVVVPHSLCVVSPNASLPRYTSWRYGAHIYIAYKENTIWHASYYNNVPFNRLEKININMR